MSSSPPKDDEKLVGESSTKSRTKSLIGVVEPDSNVNNATVGDDRPPADDREAPSIQPSSSVGVSSVMVSKGAKELYAKSGTTGLLKTATRSSQQKQMTKASSSSTNNNEQEKMTQVASSSVLVAPKVVEASSSTSIGSVHKIYKAFVTGGSGFVGRNLITTLRDMGVSVNALARSDESASIVEGLGAQPIRGDLDDLAALRLGMEGCDTVFHSAAIVAQWGRWEDFERVNVHGTRHALEQAVQADVKRFVHLSSEAVLVGDPIRNATEEQPYSRKIIGHYPRSKMMAEQVVKEANSDQLHTVIVRPRLIWGKGDTTILPALVAAVESGDFKWFSGGRYLTSTCHVRNVCEGAVLAAQKGRPGEIYFLTDGEPVQFREFFSRLFTTQGINPTTIGSVPLWVAKTVAWTSETFFEIFPGEPSIIPATLKILAEEVTVNDAKARNELGYLSSVSIEEGIEELREEYQLIHNQNNDNDDNQNDDNTPNDDNTSNDDNDNQNDDDNTSNDDAPNDDDNH